MIAGPNISRVAALIGDAARASILCVLMDRRARTATELASVAGVTPQTTSSHLSKLMHGDLIVVEQQGRHRYYRLANQQVANALEALLVVTHSNPKRIHQPGPVDQALRQARMCYDHLAGSLGVGITQALIKNKSITEQGRQFILTEKGEQFLSNFGVNIMLAKSKRRHFCQQCLDWSERKHHMAGALGAAISNRLFELNWISKNENSRAVLINQKDLKQLEKTFSMKLDLDV